MPRTEGASGATYRLQHGPKPDHYPNVSIGFGHMDPIYIYSALGSLLLRASLFEVLEQMTNTQHPADCAKFRHTFPFC